MFQDKLMNKLMSMNASFPFELYRGCRSLSFLRRAFLGAFLRSPEVVFIAATSSERKGLTKTAFSVIKVAPECCATGTHLLRQITDHLRVQRLKCLETLIENKHKATSHSALLFD